MSKRTSKLEWKPHLPLRGRSQRVPTKRDFSFAKSWASSQGSQETTRDAAKTQPQPVGQRQRRRIARRPDTEQDSSEDPESTNFKVITSPLAQIIPTVVEGREEEDLDLEVNDEDGQAEINQAMKGNQAGAGTIYETEMDIEGEEDIAKNETQFDEYIEAGHFARSQKSSNLSTVSHAPSFRLQRHSTPIPKSRNPSMHQENQGTQDLTSPPYTKKNSSHKVVPSPQAVVVNRRMSMRRQAGTLPSPVRPLGNQTTAHSPTRSQSKQTLPDTSEGESRSKQSLGHSGWVPSSPLRTSHRSSSPAAAQQASCSPTEVSPEAVLGNTNAASTPGKLHRASLKQLSNVVDTNVPTPTTTHNVCTIENKRTLFSASPPQTTKGRKPSNNAQRAQTTLDSFMCAESNRNSRGTEVARPPTQRKPRMAPALDVDKSMPTDVRVWQDGASKRLLSHLTDLDVILDRLKETAWDVKDQTDNPVKRKAINRLMIKTQNDIQQAIADSHAVVKLKTSVSKSSGTMKRKREELFKLQSKTARMKEIVSSLKKQQKMQNKLQPLPHRDQKAMQEISEFLFKLSSLTTKSAKSEKAPTEFVIIGTTIETEGLSESSSVRRRLDLRDDQHHIVKV